MKGFSVLLLVTSLFGTAACSDIAAIDPYVDESVGETSFHIKGEVVYMELEGGFWAIRSEDGTNYEPRNLPERFERDGLSVQVEAQLSPDQGTFRMVGPVIYIRSISER
jgi:hypothetical protein